jgi:putative alpha-1,2-mannosidase
MNSAIPILTLLLAMLLCGCYSKPNLYIGAGGFGFGCGSNSPLAQQPYGMMRLGPDTTPPARKLYAEFQHFGGYNTADHYLRGFSHMHLVGAGVLDLGILGVLPTKDKHPKAPEDRLIWFDKLQEYAEPGYYKTLVEGGIQVELTATLRAGVHRYTFDKGEMTLYFLTSNMLQKKNNRTAECTFVGNNSFEGKVFTMGSFSSRFGGLNTYYHVEWRGNVTRKGMW